MYVEKNKRLSLQPKSYAMSLRLYHRRSSASKDRLQVSSLLPTLRMQSLGAVGPRGSIGGSARPRSQSLYPGSENANPLLDIPARSRSLSFSGASEIERLRLTAKEEDNIFKCYARIMYVILGSMAATLICVALYALFTISKVIT